MNASFYTGRSGSITYQGAIEVESNNVANINTTGYKAGVAEFSTIYARQIQENQHVTANEYGVGTTLKTVATDISAGSYKGTDNPLDLAIDGKGWFGVQNDDVGSAKTVAYTRDGSFRRNSEGYIVNGSGNYLLANNFGNIGLVGGVYTVNPLMEVTDPFGTVTGQSALFLPAGLEHPAVATSKATVQKNLTGTIGAATAPAAADTLGGALFDYSESPTGMTKGQDLLVTVGQGELSYADGAVRNLVTVPQTVGNTDRTGASFRLNGTLVTASWSAGADGAAVAAALKTAIDNSGATGVSATVTGNKLSLASPKAVIVTDSDYPAVLADSVGAVATYGETGDAASLAFSTLGELEAGFQYALDTVYGAGNATIALNGDGGFLLSAVGTGVAFAVDQASDTNNGFYQTLAGLNRAVPQGQTVSSQNFTVAVEQARQTVVTPDNRQVALELDYTQLVPAAEDRGSTWRLDAALTTPVTATKESDLNTVLTSGDETADLVSGENLWFSAGGGNISASELGYDYNLSLPSDLSDGAAPTLSFTVNGTQISITGEDGEDGDALANRLVQALEAAGVNATRSNATVTLHADEVMGELIVSDGATNIRGLEVPGHALKLLVYDDADAEGNFRTLGELTDLANRAAADAGIPVTAVFADGKMTVTNGSADDMQATFLDANNTDLSFRRMLAFPNPTLAGSSSQSTDALTVARALDASSLEISFDENGQYTGPATVTLDNGGTPLVVDLAKTFAVADSTQIQEYFTVNGVVGGDLDDYSVDDNGRIYAHFSNGRNVEVAQIPLYHFQNEQGLERIGGNLFITSANSGDPFFYTDADGNVILGATINAKTLENSNVNTGTALTNLIIMQRAFDGAAKVITASDEMVQNAINMKK